MPRRDDGPRAPRISPPDLPRDLSPASGARGADIHAAQITLTVDTDLAHSSLEQCALTGTASTLSLQGATLLDVDLVDLRVATLPAKNTSWRRVRIRGGRIGTLDLTEARLADVQLLNVRIDYLTLGGAKVEDVLVTECMITALDLPQATITRMAFHDSRADEVDTRGMRAADLDLRGLDALGYLDVGSLRGATLGSRQVELLAPALAAASGILVRD